MTLKLWMECIVTAQIRAPYMETSANSEHLIMLICLPVDDLLPEGRMTSKVMPPCALTDDL